MSLASKIVSSTAAITAYTIRMYSTGLLQTGHESYWLQESTQSSTHSQNGKAELASWGAVPYHTLSPAATLDAGDISARGRAVDL